ncbi:MAG: hemerythrin domain-containing protein [Candidatus Parcubacteria bacterium]|nr:hemerythrin domain-containing protein [Candidatus Parcubacteria bacterium]
MNELENIVPKLIEQHRLLQKDLGMAAAMTEMEKPSSQEIEKWLQQFTADLTEHLHLENAVFYVELLKKMKEAGVDTTNTGIFIADMKNIGNKVETFMKKYKKADTIDASLAEFKSEFFPIINALNIRIESEESGVYLYWDLYNKE